jgi:hypothetical protein
MSPDAFADLADSIESFSSEFRDHMTRNQDPVPGSPAHDEAEGEPYAGAWAAFPSRDIFAVTYLSATSCTDHLLALAGVLRSRRSVFGTYTLARGAVEAAAGGCYLTDRTIDGRERLRRTMNRRLTGFCEQIWMIRDMPSPGEAALAKVADNEKRIGQFELTASRFGFKFQKTTGTGRPAHLDKKTPPIMDLVGVAVDEGAPELGRAYYRLLSASAHSEIHGLARLLAPVGTSPGHPGEALAAVNLESRSAAVELIAAPMSALNLAKGLEWFTGTDMTRLHKPANTMLQVWAHVAGLAS